MSQYSLVDRRGSGGRARQVEWAAWRLLAPADALFNRIYGWRYNPLYHSGAIVALLLLVVLVTGVYLLFFYRIATPYDSVVRINEQIWTGRWIRAVHRYASDAIVVATAVHAFRVFAQGRAWGPRALAWLSGLALLFLVFICGWTGYVMVWDTQGLVLAREGARLLDALPLFAEPIGRAFVGDGDIPSAFFFLNLFLHVALPVGLAVGLWIHVARAARPSVLPPRKLSWALVLGCLAMGIFWPAAIGPVADLLRRAGSAPFDWFYSFWLPVTGGLPSLVVWGGVAAITVFLSLVPSLTRNRGRSVAPSSVHHRLCDACNQCYQDCPYEAISMIVRPEPDPERSTYVAEVDPSLCVSCGICAGSCAPMGVGPPGRTGRDQLERVRDFIGERVSGAGEVVIVGCDRGAGGIGEGVLDGAPVFAVDCAGSLHTSVVEFLVRSGVGGVLIVACPPRDCWNREGPRWLSERLYHNREAELKPRVDRNRVRVAHAAFGERQAVRDALAQYRLDLTALSEVVPETDIEIDSLCEAPAEEVHR